MFIGTLRWSRAETSVLFVKVLKHHSIRVSAPCSDVRDVQAVCLGRGGAVSTCGTECEWHARVPGLLRKHFLCNATIAKKQFTRGRVDGQNVSRAAASDACCRHCNVSLQPFWFRA